MMKKTLLAIAFLSLSAAPALASVRIQEVDNLNLGTWTLTSMNGNDPVCVYRNTGGNAYTIRATDDSTLTPGNFYLQNNSDTAQIPYTIKWGNTTAPGTTPLFDGVTVNSFGANTASQNCSGNDSANFRIDVSNSAMAAVPAGTYKATVTLVAGQ